MGDAVRELRIRWILLRRGRSLSAGQALLAVGLLVSAGIAVAALSTYRSDQALGRQLLAIQSQTSQLQTEVAAQNQELKVAGTLQWQAELARADGLSASGESVYVIESAAAAAGPGPAQAGVERAAQIVSEFATAVQSSP